MSSDVSETTHIHNKTNQIDNTTLNSQRAPYLITKKKQKIQSLLCMPGYFMFPRLRHRQSLSLSDQDALTYLSHKTNTYIVNYTN